MNAVNSWGATPLHEGIDRGDLDVITELLNGGADLDIRATRGKHSGKNPLDMLHSRPQLAALLDNSCQMSRDSNKIGDLTHSRL